MRNVSVLVAVGASVSGQCEIPGVAEGAKEDKAWLIELFAAPQGVRFDGIKLIFSDACMGFPSQSGRFARMPDGRGEVVQKAGLPLIAGTGWSRKRYLNMQLLREQEIENQLEVA